MSDNPEHGDGDGSNSSSPSSLFFSLSAYSRFLSQNLNPTRGGSNPEHGSNSANPPSSSSFFFTLSAYGRFLSQNLNPTASGNNPEHGSNSANPPSSSSFFFDLSSYSRFRRCRSHQTSFSSSSSDSIPHTRTSSIDATPHDIILYEPPPAPSSSSVDSIPYTQLEITSALENSVSGRPPSTTSGCGNGMLALPCGSFKRCTLRNERVIVFCRHIHFQIPDLSTSHLSTLTSRSHHPSIVKLLGASKSRHRSHIYMVYEDIPGATLKECLRTSNGNPLSNWLWRMQVALDLARGLEHIHHHCGMVHNKMTSSTVIVTEPNSNACIFLFGADKFRNGQIEGTMGYAAPEVFDKVMISQKSDVYAFGVVILELISGKAACRMKYRLVTLVETARKAFCREGELEDEESRRGRVMQFVDPRLHDSFPMETAESLIQVALKCVEGKPMLRPEMASVAEDIRRLFSDSKVWQTMKSPTTSFSLSSLLRSETKEGVPSEGKLLHYPSLEEKGNPQEEDSEDEEEEDPREDDSEYPQEFQDKRRRVEEIFVAC